MAAETPMAAPPAPSTGAGTATAGELPNGLAAAVLVAAGLGAFFLGLFTTLSEASVGMHDWLQWNDRVGPLSGKTILAVIIFFASWAVLTALLRKADPPLKPVLIVTGVLTALGFLMTFPTFFQAFA